MTIQEWFDRVGGYGVDYDGYYGFQCVDLADSYIQLVLQGNVPWVVGAKDFWNLNLDWCYKIGNDPSNCPQRGDIVIWNAWTYGHVAICVTGNVNTFVSLDQNWPQGLSYNTEPSRVCEHNYDGVVGWFRPNMALDYPSGWSSADYLAANPDVAAAGVDPVSHWMHYGFRENRPLHPAPPVIPAPTPDPVPPIVEPPVEVPIVEPKDEVEPKPVPIETPKQTLWDVIVVWIGSLLNKIRRKK